MIFAEILLLVFIAATGVCALLIARRNDWNFVQPHAFHAAWLAVLMGGVPLLQKISGIMDSPEGVGRTCVILLLHLCFFTLPFLRLPGFLVKLSGRRYAILNPPEFTVRQHLLLAVAGLLLMTAAYVATARLGGFGLLNWLQFPRVGYQYFHRTVDEWYVLSVAVLVFLYLWGSFYLLPGRRGRLILYCLLFVFLSYFLGYKKITVAIGIQTVLAWHFLSGKIRWRGLAVWAVFCVAVFITVFGLHDRGFSRFQQGLLSGKIQVTQPIAEPSRYGGEMPGNNVIEKILHYSTHYDDTRIFFSEFDRSFTFLCGRSYIDGLWKYLPRSLFPQKPQTYGYLRHIAETMYPGSVASGHLPDVGGPPFRSSVEMYLNFGLPGLCLLALFKGTIAAFFLQRMKCRPDFFGYAGLSVCMGYPLLPAVEGAAGTVAWYLLILTGLRVFHRLTAREFR